MRSLLKWVVKQLEKLMAKKPVVFGSPDGSQFVDDDDIPAGVPRIVACGSYDGGAQALYSPYGVSGITKSGVGAYVIHCDAAHPNPIPIVCMVPNALGKNVAAYALNGAVTDITVTMQTEAGVGVDGTLSFLLLSFP